MTTFHCDLNMARTWHILREDGVLTLCRQAPARLDVSAATVLPAGDPVRLAHQIRQDMWRAVRNVRGFSPVVRLEQRVGGIAVTAGGQVMGPVAPGLPARIAAVLENPANRRRWLAHAGRGRAQWS